MIPDPVTITTVIGGLLSPLQSLLQQASSLSSVYQRCLALISEMKTLQGVLKKVESEYKKTIAMLNHLSTNATTELLDQLLYDNTTTCQHIQALVTKISGSRIQRIRGAWEESNIKELKIRLEGNKSTLMIALGAITEERQRTQGQKRDPSPPPPYSSSGTAESKYVLNYLLNATGGLLGCAGAFGTVIAFCNPVTLPAAALVVVGGTAAACVGGVLGLVTTGTTHYLLWG